MQFVTQIKDWKIMNPDVRNWIAAFAKDWDYIIEFRRGNHRTLLQNAYYWSVLMVISEDTGNEKEILHDYFRNKFLKSTVSAIDGEEMEVVRGTSTLTTVEFCKYMDEILDWCAVNWIIVPDKPEWTFESTERMTKAKNAKAQEQMNDIVNSLVS